MKKYSTYTSLLNQGRRPLTSAGSKFTGWPKFKNIIRGPILSEKDRHLIIFVCEMNVQGAIPSSQSTAFFEVRDISRSRPQFPGSTHGTKKGLHFLTRAFL